MMRRALIRFSLCLSVLGWGLFSSPSALALQTGGKIAAQPCGTPPPPTTPGLLSFISKRNKVEGIYETKADGSLPFCIVSLGNDAPSAPAWSPDGKYIGYTLQSGLDPTNPKLYIVDGDGSNAHVLVDTTDHFSWAPAGDLLTYSRAGDIFITDVNGGAPTNLTNTGSGSQSPAWAPTGDLIAYSQSDGIQVIGSDGSHPRNLTNSPAPGLDQYPNWSPDGKQIAFVSSRDGTQQIYTVRLEDGHITRLSDPASKRNLSPAWSPDSRQLAYVTYLNADIHSTHIMLVAADGSSPPHRLTHSGNTESDPTWSRDGKLIAFDVRIGGSDRGELHLIDAAGNRDVNLSTNFTYTDGSPFWHP